MKYTLKTAVAVLLMATNIASTADAATAKKKAAPKHAPISQSITNYSCEGSVGITSGTALAGYSRNENSISFLMSVNRMNGVVTIMQARGSRLIKSGRFTMSGNGNAFSVSIPWTDYNGVGQYVDLSFATDGTFSGSAMASTPVNIGTVIFDEIFGADAMMLKPQTNYSIEGICWK